MSGRSWTEAEIAILRNTAPHGIAMLRERLDRSGASIRQKAEELDVTIRRSKTGDCGEHMRGKIAMPEHVHPLVTKFFSGVNAERCFLHEIAARSGLARATLSDWRRKMPRIDNFDAALNSIGLKLEIVPLERRG